MIPERRGCGIAGSGLEPVVAGGLSLSGDRMTQGLPGDSARDGTGGTRAGRCVEAMVQGMGKGEAAVESPPPSAQRPELFHRLTRGCSFGKKALFGTGTGGCTRRCTLLQLASENVCCTPDTSGCLCLNNITLIVQCQQHLHPILLRTRSGRAVQKVCRSHPYWNRNRNQNGQLRRSSHLPISSYLPQFSSCMPQS